MQNFANYLNAFYISLQTVFQNVDFKSTKLLETYTDQSDDEEEVFDAGSWLGLASAAAVGTFEGFVGKAAPVLGVCHPKRCYKPTNARILILWFNYRVLVACLA